MTTAETVIPSALLQTNQYDVFHCVKRAHGFVAAASIDEPFRFRLVKSAGLSDDEDELLSSGEDLVAEVTLVAYDVPLCLSLQSTHSEKGAWNEWMFFPVMISELPLDAYVAIEVNSVRGLVGSTCFYPFTSRGALKSGARRYALRMGVPTSTRESECPNCHAPSAETDKLFRAFTQGRMAAVPWLDPLCERKLRQLEDEREKLATNPIIEVELPTIANALPVFHLSVPSNYDCDAVHYASRPSPFIPFYDLEIGAENLSEQKGGILSKSLHLVADKDAQPSFGQRRQIDSLITRPPIQLEAIKVDDAALLWQFRYFLLREPRGFVPFMSCVDWTTPAEKVEAEKLIPMWKPIRIEDALMLLSAIFRSVLCLRQHAVSVLSKLPDDELCLYLLQLVQSVRHDVQQELASFLINRAMECWEICSNLYWYVSVEADLESRHGASIKNWNRIHDADNEVFLTLKQAIMDELSANNTNYFQRIREQEQLRAVLLAIHSALSREPSGERPKRIELLKTIIAEKKCGIFEAFTKGKRMRRHSVVRLEDDTPLDSTISIASGEGIRLPSHPHTAVCGIRKEGAYLFKSAKQPMKLSLILTAESAGVTAMSPTEPSPSMPDADTSLYQLSQSESTTYSIDDLPTYEIIFKCGDDVRQDQLVLQFVQLVDSLLKRNGLDLCLTPYRIMATSQSDGFMEVVQGVQTFQEVQKETVIKYLQRHNPTPEKFERAMDRFTKSCAGYCVATFILGIGDRHLENVLLTKDGRFLHIDFGFILGNDPKPFPPPMKINNEMVDAMGGLGGKQYGLFKILCCSAFNILRKHANLLLSLLLLMIDASIPNISGDGKMDPRLILVKVQDKLRLDLNDGEASQYLLGVIQASISAIFTNIWDIVHVAAQAART